MRLREQDVLVTLKLAVTAKRPSYAELGHSLGMSASQAHSAVQRAMRSGLLVGASQRVNTEALLEFLIHGLKYAFPAVRGPLRRGIPTGHSAPPLRDVVVSGDVPMVWADPEGEVRGETISPLYKSAPSAAMSDPGLYELLALVDALRVGRAREREIAAGLLREKLQHVESPGS